MILIIKYCNLLFRMNSRACCTTSNWTCKFYFNHSNLALISQLQYIHKKYLLLGNLQFPPFFKNIDGFWTDYLDKCSIVWRPNALIVKLLSKRRLLLATKANPSSSMKDLVSTSFDVEIVKACYLVWVERHPKMQQLPKNSHQKSQRLIK